MLSRVADSLYWLGRYAERIETNAHIIDYQLESMLERNLEGESYDKEWELILSICGYIEDYHKRYEDYEIERMMYYLLHDYENFNAIEPMIVKVRENARNTRDVIPNDLWGEWNTLYMDLQEKVYSAPLNILETTSFLENVKKVALTSLGIIDSHMTRDESFMFLKIGKWLERAEKNALIIHHLLEEQEAFSGDFRANLALQLIHAGEEFTRRSRSRQPEDVLSFLISDKKSTRSIAYSISKIKHTILDMEGFEIRPYAQPMLEAITAIEQLIQVNCALLSVQERKNWVNDIRRMCTNFGPRFSQTYYLTSPILVK